jgi:hypothetical protein
VRYTPTQHKYRNQKHSGADFLGITICNFEPHRPPNKNSILTAEGRQKLAESNFKQSCWQFLIVALLSNQIIEGRRTAPILNPIP